MLSRWNTHRDSLLFGDLGLKYPNTNLWFPMDKLFQKFLANNFSDFTGLIADTTIPVPEYLINEMITEFLRGNKNVTSCRIQIEPENQFIVNFKTPLLPLTLNLKLRLDNAVDFTGSPKIRAKLENNVLLGKIGSLFANVLPAGIKMYGDQIVVDIGSFLRTPQEKRLLELVKSSEIHTVEGILVLDIKIRVD